MVKIGRGNIHPATFDKKKGLAVIAGPCQIESLDHALNMAQTLDTICMRYGVDFVYKSSFDKANRTSIGGARGVGMHEGLTILNLVRNNIGCPVITDVHEAHQCATVAQSVDALQIPALLSRQTDLLLSAGAMGIPVNIKKGQFMAPEDMAYAVEKVKHANSSPVLVCERGTSFGYHNLVVDYRNLPIMERETGCPVIFDGTHSVQRPAGRGSSSGGDREFVWNLTLAAVAAGATGLFLEVHNDPASAPSDGDTMLDIPMFEVTIAAAVRLHQTMREFG